MESLASLLQKLYQKVKPQGFFSYVIYSVLIGLLSLVIYGGAAGYKLAVSNVTMTYAFLHSLTVDLNFVIPFIALRSISLVSFTMITKVGLSTVIMLYSFLGLKEEYSFYSITGIILMMLAAILPLMNKREREKGSLKGYLLAFIGALAMGVNNILSKLFVANPLATGSSGAYCFWINIYVLIFWFIIGSYCIFSPKMKQDTKDTLKEYNSKVIITIVILFTNSAISTLFNLYALKFVDLNYYTVITNCANLIAVTFISKFFFKEKLTNLHYIAVILAVAAIILCSL